MDRHPAAAPAAAARPPAQIPTPRMLLRRWSPADAPALEEALRATEVDLQRWIPWVFAGAEGGLALVQRLIEYAAEFDAGGDALYALLDAADGSVLGGAGLYRRVGAGALEVGYWIRTERAGQGLATEAAAALTETAFALPGIERVEIRCDPAHVASWTVARKLGYHHRETLPPDEGRKDRPARPTMIWERTTARPATGADHHATHG